MFDNKFILQVLHPFILYAVIGTLVGYLLVRTAITFLGIKEPKVKITLYMLPVLVPFVTLAVRQSASTCVIQLNYLHQNFAGVYNALCKAGNFLAYFLMPLSVVAILLAFVKGLGSIVACKRLVSKYGYADKEDYPELIGILEKLADKSGIQVPKLVVTGQRLARSFTFGIKNPVIVITAGVVECLDSDETETVLAHEVAHIIRKDSMLNWIVVFFRDLMFFAPSMHFIYRDIQREKEKASDDIALELTDKHYAFGEALIKVWRLSPRSLPGNLIFDNFAIHPNFINNDGILEARLIRIIDPEPGRRFNMKSITLLSATIFLTAFTLLYFIC